MSINHRSQSSQSHQDPQDLLRQAKQVAVTDAPLTDKEKRALVPFLKASPALLQLADDAVTQNPDLFGGSIDVSVIPSALAYAKEQRPLANNARALADRIDEQVFTRLAAAGEACFAVYQAMKGLSRTKKGAALRPFVKQMAALLKTGPKKPKEAKAPPAPSNSTGGAPPAST